MGVAFGQFMPNSAYADVKSEIVGTYGDQKHLELRALTTEGKPIECISMGINDQSSEFGAEGLSVEVLGIPYPDYGEIFPHHVAAYERLYPSQK